MDDRSRTLEEEAWFLGIRCLHLGLSVYTGVDFSNEERERQLATAILLYRSDAGSKWDIAGAGAAHYAERLANYFAVRSADIGTTESSGMPDDFSDDDMTDFATFDDPSLYGEDA